jgi:hypothetical protein
MENDCISMRLEGFDTINRTLVLEYTRDHSYTLEQKAVNQAQRSEQYYILQGFKLISDDGCRIQVSARADNAHRIITNGGLLWTNLSSSYVTWDQFPADRGSPPFLNFNELLSQTQCVRYDLAKPCFGRNLLLVTAPWSENMSVNLGGFDIRAELCTPVYYRTPASVTALLSSKTRQLLVDVS